MASIDEFSSYEFKNSLRYWTWWLSQGVVPAKTPCAFLLGGQSGAGKTALHSICEKLLGNGIVINGDEFRKSHPHFREIEARYGVDAPAHTAKWSGAMTEAIIEELSDKGYNLIIEGTLRTSAIPLKTAGLLRDKGYGVSLAIMAVKPEISLVSCQVRYEEMRIAGTTPRATDPEHHNKIIREIASNLSELEASGAFESIYVYNRACECLYPASGDLETASAVLERVLFGDWTDDERDHYEKLQQRLEELKSIDT